MEFSLPVACRLLRLPADETADFQTVSVNINVQQDTVATLKEKLKVNGFVIYFGEILQNADCFRTFYDGKEKLIALDCGPEWEEDKLATFPTSAARLVSAGFGIGHVLQALGRAVWHEGMDEFTHSAHLIRRLVEDGGSSDYQNRSETVTITDRSGELQTVGVFSEYQPGRLLFRPEMGMDDAVYPELVNGSVPRRSKLVFSDLSQEAQAQAREARHYNTSRAPILERASSAVVRIFGYHPTEKKAQPQRGGLPSPSYGAQDSTASGGPEGEDETFLRGPPRVVAFTGFFVSPTLLIATKNCLHCAEHHSYASKFTFTRETRATFHSLSEGVNLFPCRAVRSLTRFLVEKIRQIGVEIPEDLVPPENMATRWNDVMLFEVDEAQRSEVFLVPDIKPVARGDVLASLAYHARPSELWISEVFKSDPEGDRFCERQLSDHFAGYHTKCCSVGSAFADEREGQLAHTCCLLPSSIGSPILRIADWDATSAFIPFVGINCGRSKTDILINSDPDSPEKKFNCGISVRNLPVVLVYQHYVVPVLQRHPCFPLLKEFLRPYKILTEKEKLRACHVKMLKDADEFNEYGMAFYEDHQLSLALQCFREGARMFSVANIPDQSEYDSRLKDALQSNVSSVVMTLKDLGVNSAA